MNRFARLDRQYVWHPFTQMKDWLQQEPLVLCDGRGAILRDSRGKEYLDANASIWTNLHGHRNPTLDAAVRNQLKRVAHTSFLGFANEPASQLAKELVVSAKLRGGLKARSPVGPRLSKVFFSDDGSTAVEAALKLAYEFVRRTRGPKVAPRFLALSGSYHGDTIGAVSVSHIPRFHAAFRDLLFKSDTVMSPYCYRCPYNRAQPERADARSYRRCGWECVRQVESAIARARKAKRPYSVFVYEPRIQGAAGMIPQPDGWLSRVAEPLREAGVLLIADEVMTGFGRTGGAKTGALYASVAEGVSPDFLCLAKGLTGGYMPMAATLTTQAVFDAFLGEYSEFRTFFHGHSFSGHALGSATALASMKLLQTSRSRAARARLEANLRQSLEALWALPNVGDIRQVGLVVGIEVVRDWKTREPFDLRERAGDRVCAGMRRRGVLTRPIGNVVVVMPPYCTTARQVGQITQALFDSIVEAFPQ